MNQSGERASTLHDYVGLSGKSKPIWETHFDLELTDWCPHVNVPPGIDGVGSIIPQADSPAPARDAGRFGFGRGRLNHGVHVSKSVANLHSRDALRPLDQAVCILERVLPVPICAGRLVSGFTAEGMPRIEQETEQGMQNTFRIVLRTIRTSSQSEAMSR